MRSERVRRAAARAAVTASRKTGRPVHPDVAVLAACDFCDFCDQNGIREVANNHTVRCDHREVS